MRRQREEKRTSKLLVYLIGLIMVGSVFGVVFFGFGGGGVNSVRDKGLKFADNGNFWSTTVDGREAIFTYVPSQVETISIDDFIINRLKNVIEIDVTSDFNDTYAEEIALAQFQMGITLNNFDVFVRSGFTSERENFQVITCEDSSDFVPVIYFKSSNETKVYLENNCIIAEALSGIDVLRIKDRLVYGVLEVIR